MASTLHYLNINSPLGSILLVADGKVLTRLEFTDRPHARGIPSGAHEGGVLLDEVHHQLTMYFEGSRRHFDIPIRLDGTPFQQRVWRALMDIPFGEVADYSHLADQTGRPEAVRAVGAANGRNPISIIVPCHRIIGKNGHLTGYAGGLEAKRWLLCHEAHEVDGLRIKQRQP